MEAIVPAISLTYPRHLEEEAKEPVPGGAYIKGDMRSESVDAFLGYSQSRAGKGNTIDYAALVAHTHPCLLRSMRPGAVALAYVEVQIKRRMTRSSDWKLKRADCLRGKRQEGR